MSMHIHVTTVAILFLLNGIKMCKYLPFISACVCSDGSTTSISKGKKRKKSKQDRSKYIITQERLIEAFIITSVRL